ncbi:MAG: hydantoinase/oxoprolinase family protein [Alphaproteobacteria bacterium]|nr:hydantoinase/oxoprolinase family protein [Alphaproteobacteria bacterium]
MNLIGVDVGGTFTDLVFADTSSGRVLTHKVPTTPADPSKGIISGIAQLCERHGVARAGIDVIFHGTTIATNAILEHDGATTGMITTAGYRDILHIGRHQRPQHYSIMQEIPWQNRPLVRRRHRKTVSERLVPPRGDVLEPLDEAAVRRCARELKAAGVEAIAVCFLFSYLDPRHEQRARAIVAEEFPGCFVTTSSSVSPQFREFERFTTTALNAFVGPKVRDYVAQLERELAAGGFDAELRIMASNGGVATPAMVAERPVLTLLSGPAAGVIGGDWAGALSGRRNLITFDVGGTSADIGIVAEGRFGEATARDTWIAGFPVLVPMIDVHTIGAGGGSIAHVDGAGAFKVGPRSAGAKPGPAAYGRGGSRPTVTDANVVLGRLDRAHFLGGGMPLDEAAAHRVVGELAAQLGLPLREAAEGVITVLNANMANAIRSRTVQKGIDPRDFALVAFGGAGPLHGAEVAELLGIPEVIVPPHPGITSAFGLLISDLRYDAVRTAFQVSTAVDLDRLNRDFGAMADELAGRFEADGVALADVGFARAGDLRYAGQGYELRVPFPDGPLDAAAIADAFDAFHALHRREYGHHFAQSAIEIVNIRLVGTTGAPALGRPAPPTGGSLAEALVRTGTCSFRVDGVLEDHSTTFLLRDKLPLDTPIPGPAIVLQMDSTTVVPPRHALQADRGGNLVIRRIPA